MYIQSYKPSVKLFALRNSRYFLGSVLIHEPQKNGNVTKRSPSLPKSFTESTEFTKKIEFMQLNANGSNGDKINIFYLNLVFSLR